MALQTTEKSVPTQHYNKAFLAGSKRETGKKPVTVALPGLL
jgi:hypothetical protein